MHKHSITCVFEDGSSVNLQASPVESIYQAALRQGVNLQTDCREGACGVCKALCLAGSGDVGDVSEEALPGSEESEGYVLTCQFRPLDDCILEFSYPYSEIGGRARVKHVRIAELRPVAEQVLLLSVNFEGSMPPFLPGQYANIRVPGKGIQRSFSFATRHGAVGSVDFYVRVLPDGQMSNYLISEARPGDLLELEGPYGQFFFRPRNVDRVLMVAGGTGLAPMLCMLEQLKIDYAGEALPEVVLLYGVNRPGEVFGMDRIRSLGRWIDLRLAAVEADEEWQGGSGFVTDLIDASVVGNAASLDAYLCGPPPMIEAARTRLGQLAVAPGRIFAERFIPSARPVGET